MNIIASDRSKSGTYNLKYRVTHKVYPTKAVFESKTFQVVVGDLCDTATLSVATPPELPYEYYIADSM